MAEGNDCFLSAKELNLTEEERDALIDVLGRLELGELTHEPDWRLKKVLGREKYISNEGFNMDVWHADTDCGTVCCIAGWADHLHGTKLRSQTAPREKDALTCLFLGIGADKTLDQITTKEAAKALRSYLTTKDPQWRKAIL